MTKVKTIWVTPRAEELIVFAARVSNPSSQEEGKNPTRLIAYLIRNRHWSPFEMANACIEIETTRDIARQILRHRSFSFQEFSQRYADVEAELAEVNPRELRMQDQKNRQSSLPSDDADLKDWWLNAQDDVWNVSMAAYRAALARGVAKEVARSVLPEGLTPTRMYVNGTIRSWLHYLGVRTGVETQAEHREVACAIRDLLALELPVIFNPPS